MISAKDESLYIADHDMQPVKHSVVGKIVLMLVGIFLQSRKITAVTIAADCASLSNCGMGELSHRGLLDILCHTHFEILRITTIIQRQCNENLRLFRAAAPLL